MGDSESLTGAVQEALLALLCYEEQAGAQVRALVPKDAWEMYYRDIARKVLDYWDTYRAPPGEHTLDLIEELVRDGREQDEEIFERIYTSLVEVRGGINAEYVLSRARDFVRHQQVKAAILDAADELEAGNMEAAEQRLLDLRHERVDTFDMGIDLRVPEDALQFYRNPPEAFSTGIKALDIRRLGPTRKELHLFIAPPGRGKSWWFVHLGKEAWRRRAQVVHITLEMSAVRVAQRYVQSMFSLVTRPQTLRHMEFEEDELGRFVSFEQVEYKRPTLKDKGMEKELAERLRKLRRPLIIKEFPTGELTLPALEAYLDRLEQYRQVVPDLILLDYADIMRVGTADYRLELGRLYERLRGLAVRRNVAIATASQGNRESASRRLVTEVHVAEDWTKIATSDVAFTYSQTPAEKELGLARIFVAKGRHEEDKFIVLLSQNYASGQFVLDEVRMSGQHYWDAVDEEHGGKDDEDE